ncbi:MAG: phosphoesterase [Desulfurococcales archaeon]|nr:phosphoesterase [Desulfurococcales archaeon]
MCKVLVYGDWDADGTVATAILRYTQEILKAYPVKVECKVEAHPSGPRSLRGKIESMEECPTVLALLDIPYGPPVDEALQVFRQKCPNTRLIIVDHHRSTIRNTQEIENKYSAEVISGAAPTSVLLYNLVRSLGYRVTPRLEEFTKAVGILEYAGRRTSMENVSSKMVDLAASISKALTAERDTELWNKFVDWLSSPLPFGEFKFKPRTVSVERKVEVIEASKKIADERDKELKDAAIDLAMSAKNLGFIKLVDARKKWKKRGATALASRIYSIVKTPVALLVTSSGGGTLLIVRASRGMAQRIIDYLDAQGLIEDKGGHGNLAMAKLRDDVTIEKLEFILRRATIRSA